MSEKQAMPGFLLVLCFGMGYAAGIVRTNLPTTLLIAGFAALCAACTCPAEKTVHNIQTAAIGKDIKVVKAMETLARQVKSENYGCECKVTRIRYCKAGTIRPHVYKGKNNDKSVKLPACIGIFLAPVDKEVAGGAAEYFFDEHTGELRGYDIWE